MHAGGHASLEWAQFYCAAGLIWTLNSEQFCLPILNWLKYIGIYNSLVEYITLMKYSLPAWLFCHSSLHTNQGRNILRQTEVRWVRGGQGQVLWMNPRDWPFVRRFSLPSAPSPSVRTCQKKLDVCFWWWPLATYRFDTGPRCTQVHTGKCMLEFPRPRKSLHAGKDYSDTREWLQCDRKMYSLKTLMYGWFIWILRAGCYTNISKSHESKF